jgi:prepilin-type processing-associated H-X9-DG protein
VEELQQLTDRITKGVRRFSRDLRPSILDDLGLVPTLESLAVDLAEEDGIEANLSVLGTSKRLSPEVELTLFRIAQEALNNARRHARASHVEVTVAFADGSVEMSIRDDGQGFTTPARSGDLAHSGKLGLIGMNERARLLGGTLTVWSQPGRGTRAVVSVPL